MRFWKEIDFKFLLVDVAVTLAAFNYIDLYAFVHESLPLFIYVLFPLQCFLVFLMWGDITIFDIPETEDPGLIDRIKNNVSRFCFGILMFSWILSFVWIMPVLEYLQSGTGEYYYWTARIAVALGVFCGLVMTVRMFATKVESDAIKKWNETRESRPIAEQLAVRLYSFLIYGRLKWDWLRALLALVLGIVFLIYSESIFEILADSQTVSVEYMIVAILLSYIPVRLLLAVRPPFSLTELLSAITAFGIFVYALFT